MKSIFTVVFTLFVAVCCAQNSPSEELATYQKSGYKIQYPMGWSIDTSGQLGTAFIIFAPKENEGTSFIENVNLTIQNLAGQNMNLDNFFQLSVQQIRAKATDYKTYASQKTETEHGEYYQFIYSETQGTLTLKFEQYYFVEDDKGFVLTLSTQTDKFDSYKTTGEQILNSFILTY